LRPVHIVERAYVEHGISNPLDHTCNDRNRATRKANMKIRDHRFEPISRHPSFIGDPQIATASPELSAARCRTSTPIAAAIASG
jgi:hypothetical protein